MFFPYKYIYDTLGYINVLLAVIFFAISFILNKEKEQKFASIIMILISIMFIINKFY